MRGSATLSVRLELSEAKGLTGYPELPNVRQAPDCRLFELLADSGHQCTGLLHRFREDLALSVCAVAECCRSCPVLLRSRLSSTLFLTAFGSLPVLAGKS